MPNEIDDKVYKGLEKLWEQNILQSNSEEIFKYEDLYNGKYLCLLLNNLRPTIVDKREISQDTQSNINLLIKLICTIFKEKTSFTNEQYYQNAPYYINKYGRLIIQKYKESDKDKEAYKKFHNPIRKSSNSSLKSSNSSYKSKNSPQKKRVSTNQKPMMTAQKNIGSTAKNRVRPSGSSIIRPKQFQSTNSKLIEGSTKNQQNSNSNSTTIPFGRNRNSFGEPAIQKIQTMKQIQEMKQIQKKTLHQQQQQVQEDFKQFLEDLREKKLKFKKDLNRFIDEMASKQSEEDQYSFFLECENPQQRYFEFKDKEDQILQCARSANQQFENNYKGSSTQNYNPMIEIAQILDNLNQFKLFKVGFFKRINCSQQKLALFFSQNSKYGRRIKFELAQVRKNIQKIQHYLMEYLKYQNKEFNHFASKTTKNLKMMKFFPLTNYFRSDLSKFSRTTYNSRAYEMIILLQQKIAMQIAAIDKSLKDKQRMQK